MERFIIMFFVFFALDLDASEKKEKQTPVARSSDIVVRESAGTTPSSVGSSLSSASSLSSSLSSTPASSPLLAATSAPAQVQLPRLSRVASVSCVHEWQGDDCPICKGTFTLKNIEASPKGSKS
ncbi:MAG TPA: hypothetical protein VFF04_00415 [Candidatus Babeliales bacterium]|nr:hypothetical protein [Candidatus Babeliales bacterium]